jgi:polyhydroxyalkanoate synthesis regulator protein
MTKLIQETFEQISQLSEEQQNILATYLKKHLDEFLKQAEKEKRIEEGTYTINDFNQETQQAIQNIEERKNLTVCENQNELYYELGI